MQQPHQHGPNCKHGHGGHGHGGHGGHGHQKEMSAKEYFQKVKQMKQKNKQFYWMEILSGNFFGKYCEQKGYDFMKSLNCQFVSMLVLQAQMMFTCEWLPLCVRPFVSGLFFPLLFLLFFSLNVIFGVQNTEFTILHLFSYLSLVLYSLTALKQAGNINTAQNYKKSSEAIKERPYLQNPGANCSQCKTLKIFRSFHCPICKSCISKFTRHSLAFGTCIGSSNQLLALGFFASMTITESIILISFFQITDYGIITNLMFSLLNFYILWISFVETATLFMMNIYFGVTEHQVRTWMTTQYLTKVPQRTFVNSVGKGLINNIVESLMALFMISGYESQKKKSQNPMQQQIPIAGNSQFEKLDPNKSYLVNWSRAFFYLTPQIPSHPSRDRVIEIMTRDQPKMIEMFKLQKKFREQVVKQTEGQGLNDFQIQQRVGMKMQQHMMKNAPQMQQMAPSTPQQQKIMQIQMMTHMAGQLSEKQPQMAKNINQIMQNLKQDKITPMQVSLKMRQIQQQLMKKQMENVMKQRQQMQKAKKDEQSEKKKLIQLQKSQDQQEQLKKQQAQVADENL